LDTLIPDKVIDQVPIGIILLGADYRILNWNRWMQEKTGISEPSACGKTLQELFPGHNHPRFQLAIDDVIKRKSPQVLSQWFNSYLIPIPVEYTDYPQFRYMQQQVRISPLLTAEGEIRAVISIIDVTKDIIRAHELTRLAHALEHASNHDPLTGVFNRRFMETWLEQQLKLCARYRYAMSCFMLDLDHFKRINDEHGHERGDRVLSDFSQLLRDTLRDADIVVRCGGEEFIALLPHCNFTDGIATAGRLLELIRHSAIAGFDPGSVTCCIGVSAYSIDTPVSGRELIRLADQALYTAKANGRNQIIPQPGRQDQRT